MEKIQWTCKPFDALTPGELYQIMKLRLEVFVVEQNCPYQDADGKDLYAQHLMGYLTHTESSGENKKALIAYARILPAGISYPEASIGRVVTSPAARRTGAGKELMQESLRVIHGQYGNVPVRIGAQKYLQKFYESFGFIREGDEYLEDGIPHVIMLRAA